jgi:hypothetical protein
MNRLRHFTENRVSICALYESYLPCAACPYCTNLTSSPFNSSFTYPTYCVFASRILYDSNYTTPRVEV